MSSPKEGGHASPDSKNKTPTSWDPEDDMLLMHLKDQQQLGWKAIASNFTNRTPNACQFRWRRLKSGNLKNPPKNGSPGAGTATPGANGPDHRATPRSSSTSSSSKKQKKHPFPNTKPPGFPSAFSPLGPSFPYDNNVSNALAGLNALSNPSSAMSTPVPSYDHRGSHSGPGSPQHSPSGPPPQTTNNYEHSPGDGLLDEADDDGHGASGPGNGGGYYADISVDPTMNLPHHQAHPHAAAGMTPRNSASGASHQAQPLHALNHNNSIIQIVRTEDRNSVASSRDSISSLPSKSMNIPHHQQNSLAHLPVMFGANGSISGPSRNSSVSHSTTVPSLRKGSVVGGPGYYSRSGSVVIPFTGDKDLKSPKKSDKSKRPPKESRHKKNPKEVIKIPWSMEEDELLINRRNRELSFAELSILLPQRTEGEIWTRIDYLEKLRNGNRSSVARERRRRQSSIGLDDVEDFYMSDIGVTEDDDDDDEVLVEVDDIPQAQRGLKRRTSSAVNPLAVNH